VHFNSIYKDAKTKTVEPTFFTPIKVRLFLITLLNIRFAEYADYFKSLSFTFYMMNVGFSKKVVYIVNSLLLFLIFLDSSS
jgi:hypothetical protein